jgi:hypothetical protein
VLKLTVKCWDPNKNMAIILYKILLHTNTNIPNGRRRCLSCSAYNYMWEYPLVSASEEDLLLFHFGECFFIICFALQGTDIAMHPETSQIKVWYPYILRSCGVHYRNNFLSGIAEVSTRGSTC